MKRSTMLRKMIRVLKKWEGYKLDIRAAKELLNTLEENGMEPPLREWKETTIGTWVSGEILMENPEITCSENSWEPEV